MFNPTGNYKQISVDVNGVDVVREREQERRARMQLLDDIREPSPQPIFGEPVKVDLEDETSRRIKNTLGDFTQVLINDPKNLIGISRSTNPGHPMNRHPSNGYSASGHPVNGYSAAGHPTSGHILSATPHPNTCHQTGYSSNGYAMTGHTTSGNPAMGHASVSYGKTQQAAFKKPPYISNGASVPKPSMPNYNSPKASDKRQQSFNRSDKSSYSYKPESPVTAAFAKSYPKSIAPSLQPQQHPVNREWDAKDQRRTPVGTISVENISNVAINISSGTISTSAPIWNCGPDTPAIQVTPFHLPASATPSVPTKSASTNQGYTNTTYSETSAAAAKYEPATNTPAKQRNVLRPNNLKIQSERKPSTEGPIAVETILKEMTKAVPPDPLTTIQTPRPEETGFTFPAESKEDTSFLKMDPPEIVSPLADPLPNVDDQSLPKPAWNLDTSNVIPQSTPALGSKVDGPEPLQTIAAAAALPEKGNNLNKDVSSSLQEDLQMSDSDDEAVPEVKVNPKHYLKSPIQDNAPTAVSTNSTTMEEHSDSSNSSSSDNGDSDSDDSSSESNDSDSSSEASDEEISSKKWGLSNFVDESQRIYSPAFLHAERLKNFANPINVAPLVKDALSAANTGTFLVPEVPVISNSGVLSPLPYPAHPTVGPRTPPSPTSPEKQESLGKSENGDAQIKTKSDDDVTKLSVLRNSPEPEVVCDIEKKGDVQNEKCKKQYSSKTKTEELSSELECPSVGDCSLNESRDAKEPETFSEKDNSVGGTEKPYVSTESSESSPENYSIKTRQRGTATPSTRKSKSSINSSNENNQKVEIASTPSVSKLKHPRACRKPNEKQKKKATPNVVSKNPEPTAESRKHNSEDSKETSPNIEKSKDTPKTSKVHNIKTSAKIKGKTSKPSPIKPVEVKKPEVKKKKKKFAIENFLQSPENPARLFTPSPVRSPLPGSQNNSPEPALDPLISPVVSSKLSNKVNSKTPLKAKKVEKLRRSVRCSERASIIAQSDSSVKPPQTENKKVIAKGKRLIEQLPISIKSPVELLSLIPQDCLSTQSPDNTIPNKIMVSIKLSMLSRIPSKAKQIEESTVKDLPKSNIEDDVKLQKRDISEKSKNAHVKIPQLKEKTKTSTSEKNGKTDSKIFSANKEKSEKNKEFLTKPKIASNVNKKKVKDTFSDDAQNKIQKKRKSESGEKQNAKKQKLSMRTTDAKKSKELSTSKTDSSANLVEDVGKSKSLERCDSTGSLSSLCSQQSQRSSKSSKEKKDSMRETCLPESKRIKTSSSPLLSIKDIKQEKVDRIKSTSNDKNSSVDKSKSKPKLAAKDIIRSEQFWDDSLSTSQYCHWDDQCKEDTKGKLMGMNQSLEDSINRELTDWDHFAPEMNKDLKETSALNKHNNQAPIMPMDYYFTEGRKQKLLAEKEKDPFQQAVKYFEAAVLFILTSQQREEYSKDPDSVYQFYNETLKFSIVILSKVKKLQSCPGSTEFKLLILCLKCQSLLNVKLYNLKIKEIKEQLDGINKFLQRNSSTGSSTHASTQSHQSRLTSLSNVPSPHSSIPSPASNSQSSNSERNSTVSVPQTILDTICLQHSHLINLHRGHDLWEQADMYMTRSNLRGEFFKEVADQSEPLTLHSSITELVKYIQKGISLVKKSLR